MYKRIIKNIIRETELNFHNADQKDVERSAYTAGYVSALIGLLNGMGHKVKSGDWDDNGCLRVGCLEIDGKVLIKNSRIDYKAVDRECKMKTTPEQLAAAGYQSETLFADGLVKMRVTKEPYRGVEYETDPFDDDGDLME